MYTSIQAYVYSLILVRMTMLPSWIGLWVTQGDTFGKAHGMVFLRFVYFIAWKFHSKRKKKKSTEVSLMICMLCLEVKHTDVCNRCLTQK